MDIHIYGNPELLAVDMIVEVPLLCI